MGQHVWAQPLLIWIYFYKSTEEEQWGAGALHWPHHWTGLSDDSSSPFQCDCTSFLEEGQSRLQNFPSLCINPVFFFYFAFSFYSILFFSVHIPHPHSAQQCFVCFQSVRFSLLHGCWLLEIIGGQVLQWESEQAHIQQLTTCVIHFFSPFLLQHLCSPKLPPPVLQLTEVTGKEYS